MLAQEIWRLGSQEFRIGRSWGGEHASAASRQLYTRTSDGSARAAAARSTYSWPVAIL